MIFKDGTAREQRRFQLVYSNLKTRCENKKVENYKNYGGRGIKNLWKSFGDFKEDMLDSYVEAFSKHGSKVQIDRIDNNGNYCKENCHWVTNKENSLNRRTNIPKEKRKFAWGESPGYRDWILNSPRFK
jgi:hypothetical protein